MNFKIGDEVVLKSGGPAMTIRSLEADNISCCWFDDKKHQKSAIFVKEMLGEEGEGCEDVKNKDVRW
jgi:uncharacterized protein YodC (DUF2158 family)